MNLQEIKEEIEILEENILDLENELEEIEDENLMIILNKSLDSCKEELKELKEEYALEKHHQDCMNS